MEETRLTQTGQDSSSIIGLASAAALLILVAFLIVLLAQLRYAVWVLLVGLIPLLAQTVIFALNFTESDNSKPVKVRSFIPSVVAVGFFLFITVTGVARKPASPSSAAGAATGGVEEVPFEILHGFGPIKEVVEVGPLDTVLALQGQEIFETKCATCHKLDDRYTGPPLRYVTSYRSPTFIMNQMLDPAQNVAKHPNMQELLKMYYTYMTDQHVSREQARTIVEYLRWEATRGDL